MVPTEGSELMRRGYAAVDEVVRDADLVRLPVRRRPCRQDLSIARGNFVGRPEETWPTWEGERMDPILQVRVEELNRVPEPLEDVALLTVFVAEGHLTDEFYFDEVPNGEGWELRHYDSVEGLEPLLPVAEHHRGSLVQWRRVEGEGPGWVNLSMVPGLPDGFMRHGDPVEYGRRYRQEKGTKVGGWPWFYEEKMASREHRYVLQLDQSSWYGYVTRDEAGDWYLKSHVVW